ncbi:MAG: hypothetical protein HYX24_02000 [Candidatus Aenigmarchaeota archaeon]|nr:hypothetical protein [Candidatus Aenigmarchaeota archaeon]
MAGSEERYWDDLKWAVSRHAELVDDYENEWIAVYDQRVVAHNPDGRRVKTMARNKLANERFVLYYVTAANTTYACESQVCHY